MSIPQLISQGISLMEGRNSHNLPGAVAGFLQSQGVNMNEIWSPAVDMAQTSTHIYIYVNTPGVKPESLDVDFFNNVAIVKGERRRPFTDETTVSHNEIIYGCFKREITLPMSVTSRESVQISAEHGVLIIIIDKSREERNRFSVRIGGGVQTSGDAAVTLNSSLNVD